MAQIIINIPDTQLIRTVDAICNTFGYQATIPDLQNLGQTIANPQTKNQFAKAQVLNFIMNTIRTYEANNAASAARQTAANNVDTQITLN